MLIRCWQLHLLDATSRVLPGFYMLVSARLAGKSGHVCPKTLLASRDNSALLVAVPAIEDLGPHPHHKLTQFECTLEHVALYEILMHSILKIDKSTDYGRALASLCRVPFQLLTNHEAHFSIASIFDPTQLQDK